MIRKCGLFPVNRPRKEKTMSEVCNACPRKCGAIRPNGFCRAPEGFLVARAALHMYEEPPISGSRGSGTIFFGGCNLGCVYCQNKAISRGGSGRLLSAHELERTIFDLEAQGAHNINLVTPSHYFLALAPLLEKIKPRLTIPIVCNCGGYDDVSTLRMLDGLVDIYLPDFKYYSHELSARYSHAPDYFEVASAAISEMHRQQPTLVYNDDGTLKKGLVVRHLVLPKCRKDSLKLIENLSCIVPTDSMLLSLMSQYTPEFCDAVKYPELARKITSFEYDSVTKRAIELGFDGFFQARSAASPIYTPDFNEDF